MYVSVRGVRRIPIRGKDGGIGCLEQVYFDDTRWVIRYLVVDTEQHLTAKPVLISPISVGSLDLTSNSLLARLTREQVAHSPDIDTDRPVSRQQEIEFHNYYGYATYWEGGGLWGHGALPAELLSAARVEGRPGEQPSGDPHLRSSREVIGYRVQAKDGRIGRVDDLIVDLRDWSIAFLVLDTRNWVGGKKVLVEPTCAGPVDWAKRKVSVNLPVTAIRTAPPFERPADVTPEYVLKLRSHYGLSLSR
jgi:hypothetical protein